MMNNMSGFIRKFQYPKDVGVVKSSLMDLKVAA